MQIAPTCSHAFFDWRCLKIRALISSSKPALPSHRRTGLMSSLFNPEAPRLCGDTCLAYSACGDTCQAASLKGRGAQPMWLPGPFGFGTPVQRFPTTVYLPQTLKLLQDVLHQHHVSLDLLCHAKPTTRTGLGSFMETPLRRSLPWNHSGAGLRELSVNTLYVVTSSYTNPHVPPHAHAHTHARRTYVPFYTVLSPLAITKLRRRGEARGVLMLRGDLATIGRPCVGRRTAVEARKAW